mmetsp:Transcript_10600/g.19032  ORF Transcript_10600/g.19032 Transcript_10600/m.19032 type:complete len:248 (-) Transcript_10600:242-985(-)|eukprot:CAMPEP_0201652716 /NCGR_PEP_ID=MMETSP0493-20130528/44618_1 /ASSEMBLY_ACC=CAM_ASM_000838 /TAXON_ID=420259 /ORGANISM="Thalassiosira gravida, Strain GMp14c1" /LENGTH=247 /DNA_ID=CAMNT_0048129241 /DNA_START=768 /DNA_END=1511 /DNA_ORIENTATION=-
MIIPGTAPRKRGVFILLEGVDRCGKTTQAALLVKHLISLSLATVAFRFPDRTTQVGGLINEYLQSSIQTDDRAIHLLFSANRWEAAPTLAKTLAEGTNVVCDRYAYSGVAFTSAKCAEDRSSMSGGELGLDWCMSPDVGLPAPDVVIFLDLEMEEAEKRGGYGGERYEKRDLQIRVRKRFAELQSIDEKRGRVPWHVVDGKQSIEDVEKELASIVKDTVERVERDRAPVSRMWGEGEYELPATDLPN